MKKSIGLLLTALICATSTEGAQAEYPAISGLPLIAGYNGKLFAIDTTPKSLPINSNIVTIAARQNKAEANVGASTVFRIYSFSRLKLVAIDIRPAGANLKKATFLGLLQADRQGKIQLPALAILQSGNYSIVLTANGVTRVIQISAA